MSVYTYAVARPFDPSPLAGLRGVDGAPVELVGQADVVAVVSPADENALPARLEDLASLELLESLARAHHAVVETVAAHAVTVPFRLATVHRGKDRVAEVLRQRHRELGALLDRFAGRVELGVKVYAVPPPDEPAPPPAAGASPGRDYLRRRRRETLDREHARERAVATAQQLDAELSGLAVDRRHHRPQDPELSGATGENVLNAAYLVDAGRVRAFAERGRALAGTGVELVVTGPWAPYSFTVEDPA